MANNGFWLEVKQEYIKANFNNLLQYLRNYTKTEDNMEDYVRSVEAIKGEVHDYINKIFSGCIYKNIVDEWDEFELAYVTKLFSAYLLTINKEDKKSDNVALATLCNILALSGKIIGIESLFTVIANCLQNKSVKNYTFGWNTISAEGVYLYEVLARELAHTEFGDNCNKKRYEAKGLLSGNGENICLTGMNSEDYKRLLEQRKLGVLFNERNIVNVMTSKDKKLSLADASDIFKLAEACHEFKREMSLVKPSKKVIKTKKDYEDGECLTVRITSVKQKTFYAESVDPEYTRIQGRIGLPNKAMRYYTREAIGNNLHVGDAVEVIYSNDNSYCFQLEGSFTDFYKSWAEESVGLEFKAKRICAYSVGYTWLTEEGLYVNVLDDAKNLDVVGSFRYVKIREATHDKSGKFVINAGYSSEEIDCEDALAFNEKAQNYLLRQFVDTTNVPEQILEEKIENIDIRIIKSLMNIVFCTSKNPNQPLIDRYRDVAFAIFLAILVDDTQDEKYFSFFVDFFKCVAAFARGHELCCLKLEAQSDFANNEDVMNMLAIYNELLTYKNEEVTTSSIIEEMKRMSYLGYTNNKIAELVRSSNCLNGKLTRPEMNRIKKAIVTQLGADEEYRNITVDNTYYGEESDTLEFKTSVVFSPKNGKRPDHENQMETIKKTVCAFLNSTTGGELLIGVNDSGYFSSLEGDIVNLYNTKKISEMSMDKYRLYVKYALDQAFKEMDGTVSDIEITAGRVTCNIFRNKEDNEILRIHVDPYEYGIVELQKMVNDIYDTHAFLRTSGATVPMTKEMCEQTLNRKLRMQDKDVNKIQKLKQALHRKRQVILKDYSSSTHTADRHVEAYDILLDINAAICYDIDKEKVVEYKISRMKDVEILEDKPWEYKGKHEVRTTDVFHMLSTSESPTHVKLLLSGYAKSLLCEEFPKAKTYVKEAADGKWFFESNVNSLKGIGRFYLGLAKDIKILEGTELSEYASEYAKENIIEK